MTFRLDFGEYRPDLAEPDAGVLVTAKNAYPISNGYAPISSAAVYSGALSAAPKGLFLTRKVDGTFTAFAATTTTLEELVGQTWTDRSGAKTFAVPAGEFVHADQFGSKFIATNYVDGPYVVDIDSGTNFAALSGSPPTARTVATVEGHVVLGSTGTNDYGVAWSDTNDETNWSTGNAGSTVLRRGGRPRRILAAAGKVVQEEGIQRIVLSAQTSQTFEFYELEGEVGTIAPNSVIPWGDDIAYLSRNGFYYKSEPIGHERIARTFFARADDTQIATVLGAFDPVHPYFVWMFRSDATSTTYDKGFLYNWLINRWAELEFDCEFIGMSATSAISPDSWSNSPDSEPLSPDSPAWAGGRATMSLFDTDDKLAFLDGDALEATFEMGDMTVGDIISEQRQMQKGRRGHVRAVRPIIDTNSAVADVRVKQRYGDVGSYRSMEAAMSDAGYCYLHASGRQFRFKIRVPSGATWSYARGVDVLGRRGGRK